jgi:hypothetical protein
MAALVHCVLVAAVISTALGGVRSTAAVDPACLSPANEIVAENCLPGASRCVRQPACRGGAFDPPSLPMSAGLQPAQKRSDALTAPRAALTQH